MLPWTRSAWFRRAVTGLSTVFVGVVLATSLLAEGSALKRHAVHFASVQCPHGTASARSRPQGGCEGHAIVIKAKTHGHGGSIKVDYALLAREMSGMPRFAKPGARGVRGLRGAAGHNGHAGVPGARGQTGARGHSGATGSPGPQGALGAAGRSRPDGGRGPQGERGARGADGANGQQGERGAQGA